MKKTLANLFMLSILLVGCEKDITTEDISQITNFATFTDEGQSLVFHQLGTPYTDANVNAEEDGQELPVTISVAGETTAYSGTTVNTDVADKYTISYSAVNSDGFAAAHNRTVVVANNGDLVTSIEGVFTSSAQREPAFTVSAQYTDMKYVFITKTGANTYKISDALGGYYAIGRDYGYNYAAQGSVITANNIATNDFTITNSVIPGFGNTVVVTNFLVDAANKSVTFTGTGNFADGAFRVQLKQVQF